MDVAFHYCIWATYKVDLLAEGNFSFSGGIRRYRSMNVLCVMDSPSEDLYLPRYGGITDSLCTDISAAGDLCP